jgi:hypothetical protein
MVWEDDDPPHDTDPDHELQHPTWPEIAELMATLRDREQHLRRRGWWERSFAATERLESLLSKIRRAFHSRSKN